MIESLDCLIVQLNMPYRGELALDPRRFATYFCRMIRSSIALVPVVCPSIPSSRVRSAAFAVLGALALALLARIRIDLPFTPVPITGQTFGVTLLSLLMGRKLAVGTLAAYLSAVVVGLPVLAGGTVWTGLGPTTGYLAGMLASAWVIGGLADRGAARSLGGALIAGFLGSACVHAFGLVGLSAYLPHSQLLALGTLPFLPGDVIKTSLACLIARSMNSRRTVL
jgi:biotin transport system substrate-specific component